jgi:ferredoxin
MAYVISDDCTMCGTCVDVCPVEAISEGDGKFVIDADTCTDCGGLNTTAFCKETGCLNILNQAACFFSISAPFNGRGKLICTN